MLIYYDGSEEAVSALRRVGRLAPALAPQIHALTVADIASAMAWSTGMLTDIAYDRIESAARLILYEVLDMIIKSGLMAAGHVAFGNVVGRRYSTRIMHGLIR